MKMIHFIIARGLPRAMMKGKLSIKNPALRAYRSQSGEI